MQIRIPVIDKQQEQLLDWAQGANLTWSAAGQKELSPEEVKGLYEAANITARAVAPATLVVNIKDFQGQLWAPEALQQAIEQGTLGAGNWVWDAKTASWSSLVKDASAADAPQQLTAKEQPPETPTPDDTASDSPEESISSMASQSVEPANIVNEINVFKDDKQHIFYSLKHLRARIESGSFSMADWGWDDETDDWVPLSQLLPKISPSFAEEESGSTLIDQQKWLERVEKLEAENSRLKSERDQLKAAASATASATLEKQDIQAEAEQLQRQLEDSQRREARARRDFEQEIKRLKETHQAEIESAQQKTFSLEKAIDDLKEQLTQADRQIQDKSENLKASQMTRKQQESRIHELEGEKEQLQKSVKSLQSDLNLEKKSHEERAESETKLMLKVDDLQQALRDQKQTIEGLESEMADRRNDRELIAAELREHMEKMAQWSGNLDKLASRLDR